MDDEEDVDEKTTGVVTDGEKASDVVVAKHTTTTTTNNNENFVVVKAKADIALNHIRRLRLCRCWYRSLPPSPSLLLKLDVTTAVVVVVFAAGVVGTSRDASSCEEFECRGDASSSLKITTTSLSSLSVSSSQHRGRQRRQCCIVIGRIVVIISYCSFANPSKIMSEFTYGTGDRCDVPAEVEWLVVLHVIESI
jgi:hypothetical protein